MKKEIIIAKYSGFCFGVKRAVDMTTNHKNTNGKIYTLGPLIHNKDVINRLNNQGIKIMEMDEFDKLTEEDTLVIRSHGVGAEIIQKLENSGANIIDATCPFVSSIHRKVKKYSDLGYQIIIVGDKDHPEVIGINGWCDNTAIVTKDGTDLKDIPSRVCIVAQTTERLTNYEKVVDIVSKNCKELVKFNTICNATKERQESAQELSKEVDLMIVIGGKNSSNTKKLYEICRLNCENTLFIENSTELPKWVITDETIKKIGITAGASTPDWVIEEVVNKIKNE
ncbi:MAG TPA: 4-hydroxy-3-methylbut-2-enyl diphosphate reductase [Defluviitaleaceae bacterium]|jgi:(E)-4-hydroxy-3-methyl-but-2-enyl pyrophosphate reductase|nr:4-hydroxy-3-methylbut-2-enyl diphosphate reductase [Candidatus Epulonipiscium sp.]HOQ17494.1 4-hydroxy-3-methylbut-2-enyl diphosphate reductase [Defluviitaleaceae bacterium]HPT76797.1 4-hydroxy-3-methylbut-2-enyl diphosphate reductase [Defluviitaleaceae bacterium]HQD49761.1 4-hydroxy-3-methylbut-2-enyl diphosphate reductase [Defluviitaleaceae bacterium]